MRKNGFKDFFVHLSLPYPLSSFFALVTSCGNYPKPNPSPNSSNGKCPRDALKLGVCANVLSGLLNITIGQPSVSPCCSLLQGLVDLEAAVCLCTAIKANILGINLILSLSLSLLIVCSKNVPFGFQCA